METQTTDNITQENTNDSQANADLAVLNDTTADIDRMVGVVNTNLCTMVNQLNEIVEQQRKQAQDIQTIKTVAVFFLIVSLLALAPAIMTMIGGFFK